MSAVKCYSRKHYDGRENDGCQVCRGHSGGVKGNENVINGIVVCDYCSAIVSRWESLRAEIDIVNAKPDTTSRIEV